MLNVTDSERTYLKEMRALGTDGKGNEVLIGLTVEESNFYLTYAHESLLTNRRSDDDRDRYLELHDKHEMARLSVLSAEAEARNSPSSHH